MGGDRNDSITVRVTPSSPTRIQRPIASDPAPTLTAPAAIVLKKSYTQPARQPVVLRVTPRAYGGTAQLSLSPANGLQLFDRATGGSAIDLPNRTFHGSQLTGAHGLTLYAEGAAAGDVTLTLTCQNRGAAVGQPATAQVKVVELTLDIYKTRTQRNVDPAPLDTPTDDGSGGGSVPNKAHLGRYLHIQDAGNHHGRALVVVHKPVASFTAHVSVKAKNTKVKLFTNETPTAGEAELAGDSIDPATIPPAGLRLWVQGAEVSNALADTGVQLGLAGGEPEGDIAKVTVVGITLSAHVPATPPNTLRSTLQHGPNPDNSALTSVAASASDGTQAAASDFEEAFADAPAHPPGRPAANYPSDPPRANPPLVVIEGSLTAAKPVSLSLMIMPLAVTPEIHPTIVWSPPVRATDDNAQLARLSAATPTLTSAADGSATLLADSVGSFHLRAYLDIAGAPFDATIDRPPFINLNYVVVRVTGVSNDSRVPNPAITVVKAAANTSPAPLPPPTNRDDLTVRTGAPGTLANAFASGPNAAMYHKASVQLVGGGPDGTRGLDRVFGGWIQNLDADTHRNSAFYHRATPYHGHRDFARWSFPQARLDTEGTAASEVWFDLGHSGWTLLHGAILDRNRGYIPEWGMGGNTACGLAGLPAPGAAANSSRAQDWLQPAALSTSAPADHLGQVWTIEEWDSPSTEFAPLDAHTTLTRIDYELHFRADLCFWTNRTGWPGSDTYAPTGPGTAGNSLYSSVYSNTWSVHAGVTFDAAAPHAAQVEAGSGVRLDNAQGGTPQARPVEGTGLEVRWPIVLHTIGAALTVAGDAHRPR